MAQRLPTFSESLIVARSRGATSEAPYLWNGLVANYNFLQGGGSTLFDTARGNDGTLTNMDPATDWVMTEKGWALDFDGSDDYVNCGDADIFSPATTGEFSCFAWVRLLGGSSVRWIATKGAASNYEWEMSAVPELRVSIRALAATSLAGYTSSYTVAAEWVHVGFTFIDQTVLKLYANGKYLGEDNTVSAGIANGTAPVLIGERADNGNSPWNGDIASTVIYNRALQPSEIQQLYEDPHAMHRLRPVSVAFVDAGGAPSASIAPAAYHQAQMAGAL